MSGWMKHYLKNLLYVLITLGAMALLIVSSILLCNWFGFETSAVLFLIAFIFGFPALITRWER